MSLKEPQLNSPWVFISLETCYIFGLTFLDILKLLFGTIQNGLPHSSPIFSQRIKMFKIRTKSQLFLAFIKYITIMIFLVYELKEYNSTQNLN